MANYDASHGYIRLGTCSGLANGPYLEVSSGDVVIVESDVIVSRFSSGGVQVFPKAATAAVKVDTASPTYGWADINGSISVRGVGGTDPGFNVYRSPIRQFQFTVGDEAFVEFHLPHDYAMGTDIYIHPHWSLATGGVNENITWGIDVSYSKGHDQAAFGAPINILSAVTASSTTQYQHIVTEILATTSGGAGGTKLDTDLIEPDGVILCRMYLHANSGATEPFLHFADAHYQTTGIQGTKARVGPNFWT